jgi:hypothetical protein
MSPLDPTRTAGASHADDSDPARTPNPAADATRSGDSDPAGATRAATDPSRENSTTLGLPDTSTLNHTAAMPT